MNLIDLKTPIREATLTERNPIEAAVVIERRSKAAVRTAMHYARDVVNGLTT